jgi:hypothetical protein
MIIEHFGRLFRRASTKALNIAAPDEETQRITAALIHLEAHGNLDRFPVSRNTRRALFETASRRHLVEWRQGCSRFELTKAGQRLTARSAFGRHLSSVWT